MFTNLMKPTLLFASLTLYWLTLFVGVTQAQSDPFAPVRTAIRSGSAEALAQQFGPTVEISFDGDKKSYSTTQAAAVMKDFFARNAPVSFEFVHSGGSNDGKPYAVGKYGSKSGAYRMFVKMKQEGNRPLINAIDFTKE
ncbi:protein of unknown function [Hymenobacter psychrotolerans DSM 18569]|uniref:DUF4783 domain-containing protein n=2 Tax=Hymenobacter psychrotolerans TaxID=344998 RepID=A0A1M7CB67_9BACT|nr:protein of unknown function [Hymenobacter psychrotolerans DSM 18569]